MFAIHDWDVLRSVRSQVVNLSVIWTPIAGFGQKEFLQLGKDENIGNQYAWTVGRWVIIALSAPTMFP